nr:GTPase HflX [Dinoroseobacter sp.]
ARDVLGIMERLGVSEEIPVLEVWNKIDRLDPAEADATAISAERHPKVFAISALEGTGFDALTAGISEHLSEPRSAEDLHLDFAQGRARSWLFEEGLVERETLTDTGYDLHVVWTARQKAVFRKISAD